MRRFVESFANGFFKMAYFGHCSFNYIIYEEKLMAMLATVSIRSKTNEIRFSLGKAILLLHPSL